MAWEEELSHIAQVLAPIEASGGIGEVNLGVSGTAVVVAIPTWMRGVFVDFTAISADVDVLTGTAIANISGIVFNQTSSVASNAFTVSANTGRRIPTGSTRSWLIAKRATFLAAIASGNGNLYISLTSQAIK